jgi:tetratricopeptide (TPR) repeat protein
MSKTYCSSNQDEQYYLNLISEYLKVINTKSQLLDIEPYNQLGLMYYKIKNLDSALFYYYIANTFTDSFGVTINNIGTIHFEKGEYDSSLKYFRKAYEIDTTNQAYLNNLASYYGTVKQFKKSIHYSEKSLQIGKSQSANLLALNSLLITYRFLKNKNKIKYYKKLYQIEDEKLYELIPECNCDCKKPDCEI